MTAHVYDGGCLGARTHTPGRFVRRGATPRAGSGGTRRGRGSGRGVQGAHAPYIRNAMPAALSPQLQILHRKSYKLKS